MITVDPRFWIWIQVKFEIINAGSLASVSTQVLTLPVLPVALAPGHVGPHVEGEDVATGEVGHIELLLVAQGISLVPEKVQEVGEAGVVLVKKEI